jgi:hypothetical protein
MTPASLISITWRKKNSADAHLSAAKVTRRSDAVTLRGDALSGETILQSRNPAKEEKLDDETIFERVPKRRGLVSAYGAMGREIESHQDIIL